jgi:hypothetical protein
VRGRGDRQELRQPLHHSEHDHFQPRHSRDRTEGSGAPRIGFPPCGGDGSEAAGWRFRRSGSAP